MPRCRLEEDKLNFLKETIHKDAILFQALLCNRMASCYFSYTFLPSKKMPRRFRKNALTFKIKRLNVLKKHQGIFYMLQHTIPKNQAVSIFTVYP